MAGRRQDERLCEIGGDALDVDIGEVAAQAVRELRELQVGDIDAGVARRPVEATQQAAGLRTIAAARLDHPGVGTDDLRDLREVLGEELGLRARRIVASRRVMLSNSAARRNRRGGDTGAASSER